MGAETEIHNTRTATTWWERRKNIIQIASQTDVRKVAHCLIKTHARGTSQNDCHTRGSQNIVEKQKPATWQQQREGAEQLWVGQSEITRGKTCGRRECPPAVKQLAQPWDRATPKRPRLAKSKRTQQPQIQEGETARRADDAPGRTGRAPASSYACSTTVGPVSCYMISKGEKTELR